MMEVIRVLIGRLGKPSRKKSAVFFNIVQTGGKGSFPCSKILMKMCNIQGALWQHKLRHRKDV